MFLSILLYNLLVSHAGFYLLDLLCLRIVEITFRYSFTIRYTLQQGSLLCPRAT